MCHLLILFANTEDEKNNLKTTAAAGNTAAAKSKGKAIGNIATAILAKRDAIAGSSSSEEASSTNAWNTSSSQSGGAYKLNCYQTLTNLLSENTHFT